MPKFQYTARTQEGKLESDFIETSSIEAAISFLQNQRLIIIEVKPFEEVEAITLNEFLSQILAFLNKIKNQEIVLFTKQLAVLIQAKVPLVQSLRVMARQVGNPRFAGIINSVASDVDAGMILSRALSKYPKVFSNFYVQMIRSGEISGRLEETLTYLSDYISRQFLLNSKARGAMIYPAFIVAAFFAVGIVMLIWVIPNLTAILAESGQKLPFTTRLLIGSSSFVRKWCWLIAAILIPLGYFIWHSIKKSVEWRYAFDEFKIRFPIFGELLKKIYLTRFSETLSTLTSSGIAISQSLEITADVVGNAVYKRIILEANESVRRGGNISSVFGKYPEVLPMVTQMISIGEQTGKLDSILKQVSVFFTEEVNRAFDNLVNLIEPILIVVLGIGVGILVAAILLPIYNLVNAF